MRTLIKLFLFSIAISILDGCSEDDFIADDSIWMKSAPMVNHDAPGLDQERFVTIKDLDLTVHYRIIGKGPIDVVWLPGWTNPLTVYSKQFDYFRDKARCIYIDLPGTGLSDAPSPATPLNPEATGPQYTMELMAEAVYAVLKKEGLHHFDAVGFSMGPRVWTVFERMYPGMIDRLVAIDGAINPWSSDPVLWQKRHDNRENNYLFYLTWDENVKRMVGSTLLPSDPPEDLLEMVEYFYEFPSDILANTFYHSNAEHVNEVLEWDVPILCLFADPSTNMDFLNLVYPGNTTYFFPGGGHVIHWIFHEEINPLIWEFVKDRPGNKY